MPSFGDPEAGLLIVGLAPGLKGANRTGRPFTGDHAGEMLYQTLIAFGLAEGQYDARLDDGLQLKGAMITNAVRCVPPANKPMPAEVAQCRAFLASRIRSLPHLRAVLALGRIAHEAVIRALGQKPALYPFTHGATHDLPGGLVLFDCYHCSRQNTNTGKLTETMFHAVFEKIKVILTAVAEETFPASRC